MAHLGYRVAMSISDMLEQIREYEESERFGYIVATLAMTSRQGKDIARFMLAFLIPQRTMTALTHWDLV